MRSMIALLSFLLAVALFFAGSIFGLNGEQWSWWSYAAWLCAVLVGLGGVSLAASRRRLGRRRPGTTWLVVAGLGGSVVVLSLSVMAKRYSDPYGGSMMWPHALAVAACLGVLAADASVVIRALHDDPVRGHS